MEEENVDKNSVAGGSNPAPEQPKGRNPGMKIVGYNMLALIIYMLLSRLSANEGGGIFYAFFIAIHVLVCIIMAIGSRSWAWLLSGLLVLVIGFSTCVGLGGIG
jgi:hypothetical protein